MPLRLAIVGPGRVGTAFGRRFAEAGAELLGFVGRDAARTAAAIAFCGCGRALAPAELRAAHVVVFAVSDPDLAGAVAAATAAAPPRQCSLWLHTSGRFGLEVFDAAASRGVRRGALHPALPFPDPAAGLRAMAGSPAVLLGDPRSGRLLRRLAAMLGMQPIESRGGDRLLYHAACALAANGLTALRALVDETLLASQVLDAGSAARVAGALMQAALAASAAVGPAAALSGPVVRGDAATVAAHAQALAAAAPDAAAGYRALMRAAIRLAIARGLAPATAAGLARILADPD